MKRPDQPQPLTLTEAIIPVGSLIALVGLSYFLFGDAGAVGPNQVALTVADDAGAVHRLAPRSFARDPSARPRRKASPRASARSSSCSPSVR